MGGLIKIKIKTVKTKIATLTEALFNNVLFIYLNVFTSHPYCSSFPLLLLVPPSHYLLPSLLLLLRKGLSPLPIPPS